MCFNFAGKMVLICFIFIFLVNKTFKLVFLLNAHLSPRVLIQKIIRDAKFVQLK